MTMMLVFGRGRLVEATIDVSCWNGDCDAAVVGEDILTLRPDVSSLVATSSAEAELYAIGLGISDSLRIYQLLQELQHHLQRPTFDFGNLDTQYNFTTSTATARHV